MGDVAASHHAQSASARNSAVPPPVPIARLGLVLLAAAVLTVAFQPFDAAIYEGVVGLRLRGDLKREVETIQQFGQATTSVVGVVLIAFASPHRVRRLLDWGLAAAATGGAVMALRMVIGRARPKFGNADVFLGPFQTYVVNPRSGAAHAWSLDKPISSDLWSMPSAHTAFAMVMAVFVSAMYPRLRMPMLALAVIVGVSRLLVGAHYPTDVIVGGAVGYVAATFVVERYWGVRLLDGIWRTLVDRRAEPKLAEVVEREHRAVTAPPVR